MTTATATNDSLLVAAILRDMRTAKGFRASMAAFCDMVEENGHAPLVRFLRNVKRPARWTSESCENVAVAAGLMARADGPLQREALTFHAALAALSLGKVPLVCRERHPGRKELASMARGLFKSLGLTGVSVTMPTGSMVLSIDVRLPRRLDVSPASADWQAPRCPAQEANRDAERKVGSVLLAAFPATDDRSDSQSDYFDWIWSID